MSKHEYFKRQNAKRLVKAMKLASAQAKGEHPNPRVAQRYVDGRMQRAVAKAMETNSERVPPISP